MSRFVTSIAVAALLAAAVPAAAAEWPAFQAGLKAGKSNSPVTAGLPGDVKIVKPGKDVPKEIAGLSGKWSGWMCDKRACDVKIAGESVSASSVTFVYSFADAKTPPAPSRLTGKVSGGEVAAKTSGGAVVTIRLRPDGKMDVLWQKGKRWASGILAKG